MAISTLRVATGNRVECHHPTYQNVMAVAVLQKRPEERGPGPILPPTLKKMPILTPAYAHEAWRSTHIPHLARVVDGEDLTSGVILGLIVAE